MMPSPACVSRRRVLHLAAAASLGLAAGPVRAAATGVRIATIGAGRMGGALGRIWAEAGHQVMFSSRSPDSLKDLVSATGHGARAGTVAEAVAFGDVIVLVVPYGAVPQIAREHGAAIGGKRLLLDVANPLEARDGEMAAAPREKGASLYLAELIPGAKIVRAFNSINFATIPRDRRRKDITVAVPIAGDDAAAIGLAEDLIRQIDYEPVLVGGLAVSRHLIPGGPLSGERSAEEVRAIARTLT